MPIHGLVLDFGGVISDMRWDVAQKLEEEHGLERGAIPRTLYACDEWHEVQVGRGDIEAWRLAAHRHLEAAAGKSLPPLHDQWRSSVRLITENVDLVRALRPPYRIAVLSNADRTLEDRIRTTLRIEHLFDTIVCSAVAGIAKPDHQAYLLAAERLDLPPEDCLFVDDAERNVTAAQEVGMTAVHYRVHRGDDLRAQLAEHGIAPAS
ncbi:MAG: HAD family phosphatase [Dehalococcoidia bacterium]